MFKRFTAVLVGTLVLAGGAYAYAADNPSTPSTTTPSASGNARATRLRRRKPPPPRRTLTAPCGVLSAASTRRRADGRRRLDRGRGGDRAVPHGDRRPPLNSRADRGCRNSSVECAP